GLESERIECGGKHGGNSEPAYLAINPHGKVPAIIDGDLAVWESNAILRYIAAKYGPVEFWPDSPAGRAAIDKWMDWCSIVLNPQLIRLHEMIVTGGDIAAAAKPVFSSCEVLERHLGQSDHLSGPSFTVADIPGGLIAYRWSILMIDK